jgi:glycosyltransferase involved in cell wall biosynthesis
MGGVASVVGGLGTYLEAAGHRVVFLVPGDARRPERFETEWGFPGYKLRLRSPGDRWTEVRHQAAFWTSLPKTLAHLRSVIRAEQIDVVNLHYPTDVFAAFAWGHRRLGTKLVVSVHGSDLFPEGRPLRNPHVGLRMLLRASDLIVAPSRTFLEASIAQYGEIDGKGRTIHNGLDVQEFTSVPEEWSDATGPPTIVCVAALTRTKGQDILLSAFHQVLAAYPDAQLAIVGDGPERAALEARARDADLEGHVTFYGRLGRAEVLARLRAAHVAVLPSRSESFGLAAIEAMIALRPVVVSAVGGLREVVTDGQEGLLVPPEDPAALAEALVRVLGDANLRARMAMAGRRKVLTQFRREHTGAEYVKQFQDLVGAS